MMIMIIVMIITGFIFFAIFIFIIIIIIIIIITITITIQSYCLGYESMGVGSILARLLCVCVRVTPRHLLSISAFVI